MKYFIWLVLLFLSKFGFSQNVFSEFNNPVLREEFDQVTDNWEQRYSTSELISIQNNRYILKRIVSESISTSFAKNCPNLDKAEINISMLSTKKVPGSGGIVLWADKTGSSALFIELNEKGKLRVKKLTEAGFVSLSSDKNDGWIKTKNFKKGKFNTLTVRAENGYFDIYLNDKFQKGFVDKEVTQGRIGLFVNALSTVEFDYLTITGVKGAVVVNNSNDNKEKDNSMDEVLMLFRNKIEMQQKEILKLQNELNSCKNSSGIDTTARRTNKELSIKNQELSKRISALETEIETKNKRLSYLESMKSDLEKSANGDLIISLTELLSKEKQEHAALKKEDEKHKLEIFNLEKQLEELKFKLSKFQEE